MSTGFPSINYNTQSAAEAWIGIIIWFTVEITGLISQLTQQWCQITFLIITIFFFFFYFRCSFANPNRAAARRWVMPFSLRWDLLESKSSSSHGICSGPSSDLESLCASSPDATDQPFRNPRQFISNNFPALSAQQRKNAHAGCVCAPAFKPPGETEQQSAEKQRNEREISVSDGLHVP